MIDNMLNYADDLGPLKIIHVHEPSVGLQGIVVIDNIAIGPSIGGMRMAEDVSTEECFRLARTMTFKNAAAGLPHGGGKSVFHGDPAMPKQDKERRIRAFACALRDTVEYIFGPDMGTDEECMAWIHDEIGRATGLPRELGGIPLDEIGATGWGVRHATEVALEFCNLGIKGARMVIQGFGAVGMHAAKFLGEQGANLVGVADSRGSIANPKGIDIDALIGLVKSGKSVIEYEDGEKQNQDALIDIECEIWIPAARPDVVHKGNVERLKTRLISPGANIAVTDEAERFLNNKGIICLPDFIANAGGVICAAMEWQGASEIVAMQTVKEKVRHNTRRVLEDSRADHCTPREAALKLAEQRVRAAMRHRRWSAF